jgi:integral membrane sensor domain MASE1
LTRITLLLAKVTIVFMPVSLMTAYFSTQLQDVKFTLHGYWLWFGIILGTSVAAVAIFSVIGGIRERKNIDKSLARSAFDMSRSILSEK